MKTLKYIALWIWVAVYTVFSMVSCSTTTTRTVTTDKAGTVTEITVTSKASDPHALALAGQIATAYAPRGMIVRHEKSAPPGEFRRILRSRPITRQEIALRWKPSKP